MEQQTVFKVETALGVINVYEDYCVISAKKNAVSFFITKKYFNGDKKFYYADLTSVQFREPGRITDGYLEFEFPGSRSGVGDSAYTSENAFAFAKVNLDEMRKVYEYIDGRIHAIKSAKSQPQVVQAASPVDELRKYKQLLDEGIISQEEFDAMKKQLLNL